MAKGGAEKMKYLETQCKLKDVKVMDGEGIITLSVPLKRFNDLLLAKDKINAKKGDSDHTVAITLQDIKKKRSLDANAYMWILCQKIAEKVGNTKNEVYQEHIKNIGVFEPLPIKFEAVDKFMESWGKNGVGWISEIVGDSKLKGYKLIHAYYGSSTYDTKQMSLLIDNIVQDCKALEIETMTPAEMENLKRMWGEK